MSMIIFMWQWTNLVWPLIVTHSESKMTVQLGLSLFKNEVIAWELLMAATTVVMLPLVILFFMAQKYFVEGLVTSGIKG